MNRIYMAPSHAYIFLEMPEITNISVAAEPKQLHELNSGHDYRYHPKIIAEVEKVIAEFLRIN